LQILVNGEPVATDARTLAELCATLGFAPAKVATAVNGSFVASAKRGLTPLEPRDEVEIVAPRQGG
jgi:sulfur carrier protein